MRRLQQLLQARIIFAGDVLYFTFKKHIFTGQIAQGGLIWHCTWQKPGENAENIFRGDTVLHQQPYVRTFESLTDWTETCIQECLDEYHTRYSSWKRVRHQRSDQPMEVLFKHLQRREMSPTGPDSGRNVLLFEQIAAQQHHIEKLVEISEKWKVWFEHNFPEQALPIDITPQSVAEVVMPEAQSGELTAQPFVLTSESGQYMVLHRLNEVAPQECVSWLKQNGTESFAKMLHGIKQPVTFGPVHTGTDTWEPVDTETSKRFVHTFFNSQQSSHLGPVV
jgi:hypothetical protein